MSAARNSLARNFKALHRPGSPVVLANIYDAPSAKAVASLNAAKAIATASYAIAQVNGVEDDDLTRESNLAAVQAIATAVKEFRKPISVDFQDGYGEQLEDATEELLQIGIVGVNIEDCNKTTHKMYDADDAASRIRKVLAVAKSHGVPDFVVNARCDTLVHGGSISEVISRGKKYLAAGATTVFVWGGSARGGISRNEVVELVEAFGGKLNVSKILAPGGLSVKQLTEIGVARISIGPALQFAAMAKLKEEAQNLLEE